MQAYELLKTYRKELIAEIEAVQEGDFEGCIRLLLDAYRQDKQIFLAGNGGSAATANHFLCDFGKNAVQGNRRRFRVLSVCDNIERITSLGNDIAYEAV
ncbi:MAG: SIS domain-containing protein, partial [Clostridia bacterium]|nr:SIS domain-containing protein [Clostridia bacterium]